MPLAMLLAIVTYALACLALADVIVRMLLQVHIYSECYIRSKLLGLQNINISVLRKYSLICSLLSVQMKGLVYQH